MSMFRTKALNKLSSPDNLDEAMVAASPMHWVFFLAGFGIVATAVSWGFFGTVPTRVTAQGILLARDSEVFSASAEGGGELLRILVRPGDWVDQGQVLAELDQDVDIRRRHHAAQNLATARQEAAEERAHELEDHLFSAESYRQRHAAIEFKIANAKARRENLRTLVADMRGLLKQGYIQRTRVLEKENELIRVGESIEEYRNDLIRLEENERARVKDWEQRIEKSDRDVEKLVQSVADIDEFLERVTTVNAPISGVVTEISASIGSVLSPGAKVARIVPQATGMDALLFIPAARGKLIKLGYVANIEPSVAKKEEFGTLLADVRSVSRLAVSETAIRAMLHNDKLVEQFSRDGAPIVVRAQLRADESNPSNLKWTSEGGPEFEIEHGTLAQATVTVRRQRPVTLILPFLKSFLGI